jgi:SHS2 domain-containing protein
MTTPDYTLLDHTADLGIRIRGTDPIDLFENAGRALMHLILRMKSPGKTTPLKLSLSGDDLADLMVRWLGEILYLFEGENLVVTEILMEIKAVTYHQIEVVDKGDMWESSVIFDL